MSWKAFKEWFRSGKTESTLPQGRCYPTLDDRQKEVYQEWRGLWENGGNLAVMMELDRRIHELEKEKNK